MMLVKAVLIYLLFVGSLALTETDMEAFVARTNIGASTGLRGKIYVTDTGNFWNIVANGVLDHVTGTFPGSFNPNSIEPQSYEPTITKKPSVAAEATCLSLWVTGIAMNGMAFYSPWTCTGLDTAKWELFYRCDGHPNWRGAYHYHRMSSCLIIIEEGMDSPLIGVAFDGFGIYGPNDENRDELTSDDLDECHARYSSSGSYQYHATRDFPYILGCFRGTPYNIGNNLPTWGNCRFGGAGPETDTVA